jgi:hypothetical protein
MFPGEGSGDGSNITPFGRFGNGKAEACASGDPPSSKFGGRAGVAGGAESIGDTTVD